MGGKTRCGIQGGGDNTGEMIDMGKGWGVEQKVMEERGF